MQVRNSLSLIQNGSDEIEGIQKAISLLELTANGTSLPMEEQKLTLERFIQKYLIKGTSLEAKLYAAIQEKKEERTKKTTAKVDALVDSKKEHKRRLMDDWDSE